jgi:uncharacterized protein YndB with AHSA1/START domain
MAPPEVVFGLAADAPGWQHWAGPLVRRSWWEREGAPEPGGVGAVRRLGSRLVSSREEIVAYQRPHLLAYTWSTRLVRDYRAELRLEPEAGGTRLTWSGEFRTVLPLTGGILRRLLAATVGGFARRLAATAARRF